MLRTALVRAERRGGIGVVVRSDRGTGELSRAGSIRLHDPHDRLVMEICKGKIDPMSGGVDRHRVRVWPHKGLPTGAHIRRINGRRPMRCSSVAQSWTSAAGWAARIAATSLARFFFEGRLFNRIGVMVARTRSLGAHPHPSVIVVSTLRGHLLSAGLLGDPACDIRTGPQPTPRPWSLDRCG